MHPLLEVVFAYVGQLLQKGDHRPDFRVGYAGRPEARHASHVDAVLHNPEQMARLAFLDDLGEIGRVRPQPLGEFLQSTPGPP